MRIQNPRRRMASEAVSEISNGSLKELRAAISSQQPMPLDGVLGISQGTLKPALEAIQALVRAQGAALFVVEENRTLRLHLSTLNDSSLGPAPEVCVAVSRSAGLAAWRTLPAPRHAAEDAPAFMAIPLCDDARLLGVLYLEGVGGASSMLILWAAFRVACLIVVIGVRTRDRRLAERRVSWGFVWAAGTLALIVLVCLLRSSATP